MSDRKNPFIELGFPEYAGFHMLPFGMPERAVAHENSRQRVVASIILELHLMALITVIKKTSQIRLDGAHFQSLEGDDESQTQAAHCVPRQILIGGRAADQAFKLPEDGLRLRILFGETEILPVNFNKSDSRAERKGLAEGFLKGCKSAITAARDGGKFEIDSIMNASATAYSFYESVANTAFKDSVSRLKEKLKPTKLKHRDKVNWTEQLFITEAYLEALQKREGRNEGLSMEKIRGLMTVYEIIKKDYE